ncbi:hypothetical protein [Streptomyces sp. NBC_00079]|uniref:hypothetical protein n=1 Tax=Streptomyces sp. NBC_00079 TaxID=2975644 RepID=UPI00324FDB8A
MGKAPVPSRDAFTDFLGQSYTHGFQVALWATVLICLVSAIVLHLIRTARPTAETPADATEPTDRNAPREPPTRRSEPPRPRDPSRTPRTRRSVHGLQAPTSGRRPFTDTANPAAGPRTAGTGLPARRAPGTRHGAPAGRLAAKIRRMKEVLTVNG